MMKIKFVLKKLSYCTVLSTLFILCLGVFSPAYSEVTRSPDEVSRMTREISQEVLSPYCPGKTLAMCPSGQAGDVRREIQAMASTGMEKEEIKETLIGRFGEEFRMNDAPAEDNYKLFGAIVVGFGLSITAVTLMARRRRPGEGDLQSDGQDCDDDNFDEDERSAADDIYLEELRSEYQD